MHGSVPAHGKAAWAGGRQVGHPIAHGTANGQHGCPTERRWFQHMVRRVSGHIGAFVRTPDLEKLRDFRQAGRKRAATLLRIQGLCHERSTCCLTCEVRRCVPQSNWPLHFCVQELGERVCHAVLLAMEKAHIFSVSSDGSRLGDPPEETKHTQLGRRGWTKR